MDNKMIVQERSKKMFDIDDVTFWGMNIPKKVEKYLEMTKAGNRANMTNSEYQCYCLGISNTISIMKQLLDEGNDGMSIIFYNPNVGDDAVEYRADDLLDVIKMEDDLGLYNYNDDDDEEELVDVEE